MRQKSRSVGSHGEKVVKDIRRATRKQYSAEEKIRIVLDGLKGTGKCARYHWFFSSLPRGVILVYNDNFDNRLRGYCAGDDG